MLGVSRFVGRVLGMALEQRVGDCPRCGEAVMWSGRGRRPRWCSTTCRQRAKEARRVARDNEQPLLAVDGPARPRTADDWVAYLSSPTHRGTLLRALDGVISQWRGHVSAPPEADAVMERMFDLPPGSGAALRAGLPLPDADQRRRELDRRLVEAEHRGYERGINEGRRQAMTRYREPAPHTVAAPTADMTRQQRRAADRAARKHR